MNSFLLIIVFLHLCWVSLSLSAETVCIESERETLLKLKHNLIDPSNRLSSWNASLDPNCCQWDGVVCNNVTSHIAELHLNTPPPLYEEAYEEYNRRAFSGEINHCLVDLKHLNYLDFSGNLFYDVPIPSFIATMTSLTHLNLSNAEFMGNIPPQMGNLSNLLYLDLSYAANGTIPSQIGNLSNLLHLQLIGYYYESLFYENVDWLSSLSKLSYLHLSHTRLLVGGMPIPSFLGSMTNLIHLDLSFSGFMGNIPPQIGNLSNLAYLDLTNAANGAIPSQIGNLSHLLHLRLPGDYFVGKDDWLSSLSKLEYLDLGGTNLSQSFQLLHTLHLLSSLKHLHLSECTLPRYNQPSFVNFSSLLTLDLSKISYPYTISTFVPKWVFGLKKLVSLFLYGNHFEGPFPDGLRNLTLLENLDLNGNSLSSSIPHWLFGVLSHLKFLDLSYNNLQGVIPDDLGNATSLVKLDLSFNKLEGPIPTALKKNNNLISLDIGENNLSGSIPTWIGEKLPRIKILRLRSNNFSGHIPNGICDMKFLQDFDLAQNSFSGNIPNCLNNFSAMFQKNKGTYSTIYTNEVISDVISIIIWTKGRPLLYKSILGLVTNVDLSNNKLSGEIPREITYLDGLIYLNLSGNQLSGQIPPSIGNMRSLEFIDLSRNQLSGKIPPTISNLSFLNNLDLSHNHLEGEIPTDTQIQSFEASYFVGNNLCGPPLPINCSSNHQIPYVDSLETENGGHGVNLFFVSLTLGFIVSFTVGFIVGFWILIAPLVIYRSWRYAYFSFLDNMCYKVRSYFILVMTDL